MPTVKVSAVSLNTTPLDFGGNRDKIIESLKSEKVKGSDFILFPELCVSGYGCEDAFYKESVWARSWKSLEAILPFTKGKTVIIGLPVFHNSHLYNCAAVLHDLNVIALIPKLNLANTGIHYESRWFHSSHHFISEEHSPTYSTSSAKPIPFGHFVFKKKSARFAIEICEDSWVAKRASHLYTKQGIDILFSPSASHFSLGKREIRHRIFQETSRTLGVLTVFTNLCGNESGRAIYEGGSFFCVNGEVVSEGARLFFSPSHISSYTANLSEIRSLRAKEMRSLVTDSSPIEVSVINLPPSKASHLISDMRSNSKTSEEKIHPTSFSNFQDFTRAVSLGLYDYMRKSKTKGYTLSLSGGADSAVCALLVTCMKDIAKHELGNHIFGSRGINESRLLVTLYQKTENNSPISEEIARVLATELSAEHHQISIDDSVSLAVQLIESQLNRKLSWDTDDLALQNIQARVRSPLIWLLANLNGHLLLSTGNRSETSVGYTTMDGDASGSLCPISGVSKEFILLWIDDIQAGNNPYITRKESLRLLRQTKPTAELRPLETKQEDEKDLMPYPMLQEIERNLVYLGLDTIDCQESLKKKFPTVNNALLEKYIQRFTLLFKSSQWKRERLAPSFHLDEYGLDPKTSYRYPILSGDF